MATKRKDGPYIWVTWLTKLLIGENSCEFSSWFKAQHDGGSYAKVPSDFNQVNWLMNHTAAINQCRNQYEDQGYSAYTEGQNSFALPWGPATIGGKPDLIILDPNDTRGTIIDVKTGRPSPTHIVQVMLYMYAIPRALEQYQGWVFDGRVVYPDHDCIIAEQSVGEGFIGTVTALIERLASDTPARRVASLSECRYCDITKEDCPTRIDEMVAQQKVQMLAIGG